MTPDPAAPLGLPILAFAGEDGHEGSPERRGGWRRETTGRFHWEVRPGGRFPDEVAQSRIVRAVAADLLGGSALSPESGERAGRPNQRRSRRARVASAADGWE
jgi:hypothetical protein